MPTLDTVCSGVLRHDDGSDVATRVTLSMMVGQESHCLGDIKSTLTVHDDPAFAKRCVGKRFVFVSAHDSDDKIELFIVAADGTCIAFPLAKREQPCARTAD
jgi:hypothetical protein